MKSTYKRPERLVINATGRFNQRKGMVYNPKTQLYDIETALGAENPKTGEIWCEDIPVIETDDSGRPYKTYGKWIEKDLIQF